ncbi:hypothetical protein TCE0_033f09431 [Talaromyces pinophilus]|jgi:hypothetical protein|uniref:Uncharacterized protein n=1 Tax=Talaromyces pinophilus TaxID=128442 RepID=A0A6V8HC89_TALPI|nr:hypothetical protein TCE0_033f09431 [Talaromyces pinophilus]
MAKQTKVNSSGRRRNTQAGQGLVTSIADIDLSHCGGNLTNPVRDLEWLAPHAQELNTSYRRKAAKIYTHGAAADLAPCSRCASGKGPFQKCVIAWDEQGYISNGNCANCYWFHKTSSCSRRYVLPCQALYDKGLDLGEFEEACRIHCDGEHIIAGNAAAHHHADEPSDEEEESSEEGDEDDEDDEADEDDEDDEGDDNKYHYDRYHSINHLSEYEVNGSYEVEEAEEDDDDDGTEANHYAQPRNKKRKADDDEEYKPSKAKKARGFTPVNYCRA